MNKSLSSIAGAMVVVFSTAMSTSGLINAAESDRDRIEVSALEPQIGDTVPEFQLPDQNGNIHTLESVMGPNGAMLLFHRSADW